MTNKWFKGLFSVLVLLGLLEPAAAQKTRPAPSSRHTLWKVQGKRNTVYLLGSVHFLKPENYPLPSVIESAFTNSGIVAFETDINQLEQPDTQMKLLGKAMLPEGESLSQELSPEIYASFSNHMAKAGLPAAMFERFKPSMAAMSLQAMEALKAGLEPQYGLDQHFYTLARQQNKTIIPLETVDFQISLITDCTKAEGDQLMKSTLSDIDTTKNELNQLLTAWQSGDVKTLDKLLSEGTSEAPTIMKRFITDRNESWIPKIEEMLHGSTNAIVIVGADHLIGNQGVVNLLRKQGEKVVQE